MTRFKMPTEKAYLFLIQCVLCLYTIITWPIYFLVQKPWKARANHNRLRSVALMQGDDFVLYRSVSQISEVHVRFIQDNIDTMEKVFRFAVRQHGQKAALGTREILAEEDEIQPNGRVFKKFVLGSYQWRSFTQMENEAESFGRGLRELGINAKENVVLFAETRAEWLIASNGCMKQNMPLVTLYATLGEDALIHGINETEVSCVITSQELLPKFRNILPCTPNVTVLVVFEDAIKPLDFSGYGDLVKILPYREVIRLGEMSSKTGLLPKPEDTAIVMYTSGSTGPPKGVLMSHQNVMSSMLAYTNVAEIFEHDVYMAYLPLAHVLELIGESMCMLYGIPIGYSNPLTMTDKSSKIKRGSKGDASVLKPTIIASVPLILDRIYKSIQDKVASGSNMKKAIFDLAMQYKLDWFQRGYDTPIINSLIFRPIRAILGGRIRFILAGGAPLAPETHRCLRAALCCPVLQGYGLTETCSATTMMDMDDRSTGMTGGPLTCCDIKLVNWEEGNYRVKDRPYPRGEIHVGGPNVAVGYYKQPQKTAEEFYEENGRHWFRTGDIGEFRPEGNLKIVDRKKDLVKLQLGEYVSLGKVESELKTCPLIDNVCVYADPTKMFVVALVMPNLDHLKAIAVKSGIAWENIEEICLNNIVEKSFLAEIQKYGLNCRLQKFEIPQALKLVSEVWTPDMGLVTAAFKLKRKNIQDRYQLLIDRMYS
ncbi:long-chain-fatty-acid--CoA ligase 4-like isoform X3 [Daphnia carinata]|uniref:long-chain-fatty-acid--CoA ligase 4-like isoform X3 n=1 Tax=Daphnia carinata TaxID=120202 RepID=UPI002579E372|nr:long-chain-fatty-acid--CoA ligase 4-like isoform X3 [Daphnia carinata]